MGAILDLPSPELFGDFSTDLDVHVIDSSRPQNLSSLFGGGESGDKIIIWDDGGAEQLEEERKAWEEMQEAQRAIAALNSSEVAPSVESQETEPPNPPTISKYSSDFH